MHSASLGIGMIVVLILSLLDYIVSSGNTALADHLKSTARNALYTSKTINGCIGRDIDKILDEIREAKYLLFHTL